jgi:hypothetical protein
LRGLPISGACPECSAPVERSLLGDLIAFSSPEYQSTIHRGVFLVQAGIIGSLLLFILGIVLAFAFSAAQSVMLVGQGLSLIPAALSVWGWWLLSSPDPGQLASNKGESPRQVIRVTVAIQAAITVVHFATTAVSTMAIGSQAVGGIGVMALAMNRVARGASVAQFFAAMLYIKWLATRLPSPRAEKRAKLMLWLGPVLYTGGLLLVGLGPLIALIMYYNLLEWVRKDLKAIRAGGVAHV